jgi:hypothetical protein
MEVRNVRLIGADSGDLVWLSLSIRHGGFGFSLFIKAVLKVPLFLAVLALDIRVRDMFVGPMGVFAPRKARGSVRGGKTSDSSSVGGAREESLTVASPDNIDGLNFIILKVRAKEGVLLNSSHCDGLQSLVVVWDHFKIQGSFVHSLEAGIGPLHDLLSDRLM